jgi:hypothetical protein
MTPVARPARRLASAVLLVAGSAALHALVLRGAVLGLAPAGGAPPPPPAEPVRIVLLRTAEAVADPATAASAAAPVPPPADGAAPRSAASRTAPALGAQARGAGARDAAVRAPDPASAPAGAIAAVSPAEWGALEGASPVPSTGALAEAGGPVGDDVPAASSAAGPVPALAPPVPEAATARAAEPPDAAASARSSLPPLPATHRQRFRVYWGDYRDEQSVARLEYRLEHDGERYEIRTEGEAQGLISLVYSGTLSQVSVGRMGPDGLEPLRYAEQRGRRAERSIAFDQDAGTLRPLGDRPPVPMPEGTQDRLSVVYQIGLMARADPGAFVPGAVLEVPVASMRDVRRERFAVVGDETLWARGVPIRALHLRRPPLPGSGDPGIDLWLGYDFEMLPVRLRVEDADRRVIDQVIERDG